MQADSPKINRNINSLPTSSISLSRHAAWVLIFILKPGLAGGKSLSSNKRLWRRCTFRTLVFSGTDVAQNHTSLYSVSSRDLFTSSIIYGFLLPMITVTHPSKPARIDLARQAHAHDSCRAGDFSAFVYRDSGQPPCGKSFRSARKTAKAIS